MAASVAPGAQHTFTYSVTAPSTPGTHNFQWGMIREGTGWFGPASTNMAVNVTASANQPTLSVQRTPTPLVAGQNHTLTWSSTKATSVTYTCTASGTGYTGSATLATSGTTTNATSAAWVGYPSTCTWKATGAGGSTTVVETMTTVAAPAAETVTYFHNDIAGTPQLATNASGAVVWKENYLPYGQRQAQAPASAGNKLWYTGKPHEEDTGLTYMGARYYMPLVGRFAGIDPVDIVPGQPHSLNRYAYGNNNPYKYIDPNGKYAESVWDAFNIALGFNSLVDNIRAGNWSGAALDGVGLALDGAATAIPVIPGGAAAGIKAYRAGEAAKDVAINVQKQAGHVPGTPQNINRIKQGKPTSSFHGEQSGEMATRIAHERGTPVPGRPNVKEHDFGVGVGTGPNGGTQTRVRVHESPKTGEIHGHPSGPERF